MRLNEEDLIKLAQISELLESDGTNVPLFIGSLPDRVIEQFLSIDQTDLEKTAAFLSLSRLGRLFGGWGRRRGLGRALRRTSRFLKLRRPFPRFL